jgi:hypothetical protein
VTGKPRMSLRPLLAAVVFTAPFWIAVALLVWWLH